MVSVESTIDTNHEDMIHDAQMDYYGTRLATCSSDKSIKIFELKVIISILKKKCDFNPRLLSGKWCSNTDS